MGIASVLLLLTLGPKQPLHILFIGNSHTQANDLPVMVQNLLQSDGARQRVEIYSFYKDFLNSAAKDPLVQKAVVDPKWDVVVLQAAKVSSSHKYVYDNTPSVNLARRALKAKSRVLWFVEWPRDGWDESDYQMRIYKGLQKQAPGSEIVPVCYAWDALSGAIEATQLRLWDLDGNHATPIGTFLAANVFYYYLTGSKREPSWTLPDLSPGTATLLRAAAKAALHWKYTAPADGPGEKRETGKRKSAKS